MLFFNQFELYCLVGTSDNLHLLVQEAGADSDNLRLAPFDIELERRQDCDSPDGDKFAFHAHIFVKPGCTEILRTLQERHLLPWVRESGARNYLDLTFQVRHPQSAMATGFAHVTAKRSFVFECHHICGTEVPARDNAFRASTVLA